MTSHTIPTSGPPHAEHAHGPAHASHLKLFLTVFVLLCVLTGVSFCTYFDFWKTHVPETAGWALMMAVAVCKALLVALFFMHLRWEANWKYVLTIPSLVMAAILAVSLIPDIGERIRKYDFARRQAAAVVQRTAVSHTPGTAH